MKDYGYAGNPKVCKTAATQAFLTEGLKDWSTFGRPRIGGAGHGVAGSLESLKLVCTDQHYIHIKRLLPALKKSQLFKHRHDDIANKQ
jgi:hypothetical protein